MDKMTSQLLPFDTIPETAPQPKVFVARLTKPKTQLAEVLYGLLTNEQTSHDDFPYVRNLTARIADLRHQHNLNVVCVTRPHKNRFGHPTKIGFWSLPAEEKAKAMSVYAEINL